MQAIKEAKDYAEEHFVTDKSELLRRIVETSVGKFWFREELINKELWGPLLDSIDFCLENNYSVENFKGYFSELFAEKSFVTKDAHDAAIRLYEKFLELEDKKVDRIWTKVIKNSFAPLLTGKFDYVVGNPPWINWESLPDSYKKPCILKNDYIEEKPVIPQETIIFVPFEDEKEAHYVCSVLNSNIIEFVLRGYSTVGSKSFASAHVLTHIKLPKFNSVEFLVERLAQSDFTLFCDFAIVLYMYIS